MLTSFRLKENMITLLLFSFRLVATKCLTVPGTFHPPFDEHGMKFG